MPTQVQTTNPPDLLSSSTTTQAEEGQGIQFGSGNNAAAMVMLINLLIQLAMKMQENDGAMAKMQSKVQGDMALASSKAVQAEANYRAAAQQKQAIQSAVSAGVAVVQVAAPAAERKFSGINEQVSAVQAKTTPIEKLQTLSTETPITKALAVGPDGATPPQAVNPRREELLKGHYGETATPVPGKTLEQLNEEALTTMTPEQRADFKKTLETELSTLASRTSSLSNDKTLINQKYQMGGEFVKELSGSTTGFLGAQDTQKAGASSAEDKVLSAAQQMAGQGHSTAMDNLRKHTDAVSSLLALLRQMVSTSNNNG